MSQIKIKCTRCGGDICTEPTWGDDVMICCMKCDSLNEAHYAPLGDVLSGMVESGAIVIEWTGITNPKWAGPQSY